MKNKFIDFFSDTNTNVSYGMRQAMFAAEVGNEVAGEDPTVNKLIETCCELLGKEDGIFLPSGTMANLIAFKTLIKRPGDCIILDKTAHPLNTQSGLIPGVVGASVNTINGVNGVFDVEDIYTILTSPKKRNIPRPRVVSIEQTTNFGGGAIWPVENIKRIHSLCDRLGVGLHMDGARLFNASIETNISPKEYCQYFDSVYIDFAKGLGAPIGAALLGSKSFIEEAWYYKFQLGGGMHQAGIIAAACLYGLENNVSRLKGDHKMAKLFAELLYEIPQIDIDKTQFKTNIIYFSLNNNAKTNNEGLLKSLSKYNVRLGIINDKIRAITHLDINAEDINYTVSLIKETV